MCSILYHTQQFKNKIINMTLITFGKYAGITYQELLKKDINYCKFIDSCPVNDKTKDFKEFLSSNLQAFITKTEHEKIQKKLNNLV